MEGKIGRGLEEDDSGGMENGGERENTGVVFDSVTGDAAYRIGVLR